MVHDERHCAYLRQTSTLTRCIHRYLVIYEKCGGRSKLSRGAQAAAAVLGLGQGRQLPHAAAMTTPLLLQHIDDVSIQEYVLLSDGDNNNLEAVQRCMSRFVEAYAQHT